MVKLILLYHQLEDGQFFDEDHYHKVHLATAIEFAGKYHCRKIEIGLSIEDVPERAGRPSQFHRFMELHFDNIDDLRSCVFSKEMLALNPDAVNYHNVGTSSGLFEAEEFFFGSDGKLESTVGPWTDYFKDRVGVAGLGLPDGSGPTVEPRDTV